MKKSTLFIALLAMLGIAASAQVIPDLTDPLGTPGITLHPIDDNVPVFQNDLPVIKNLGLRIDLTGGTGVDPLSVKMQETTQDLLGMGFQTKVWGYEFPGLPTTYPGATIVAMKNQVVEINWKNKLPGHFLPVDPTLHLAHPSWLMSVDEVRQWYADGNVPTVAHLHGGHTESASDGLPEAWYTQNNERGDYYVKKIYRYDNDQEAATLWYHDHALGITRLNVYAGLAGFYLLRDEHELGLIDGGILPGGDYEIEMVIQDRLFDKNGQLFWPSNNLHIPWDDFIAGEGAVLPPALFPDNQGPTALAEFFGNIILVNGKAWPRLSVEPTKYRFRILNGSDSRFYIIKLGDALLSEDEPPMLVVGTDNGLVPQAVAVNELVIAPGERYDVVIDFSGKGGKNITMLNWGPDEPYGGVPDVGERADYNTTGRIMQFQVSNTFPVPSFDVVDGMTLNPLYAETLPSGTTPVRKVALFEGMDEFGRLQPMVGTVGEQIIGGVSRPDLEGSLTWFQDITENPDLGATEVWEVYNATADAHPIHLHLVKFQILNRQNFTPDDILFKDQLQHNGNTAVDGGRVLILPGSISGDIDPIASYENGWKDTFIVPPGQVGRFIATFDRPGRYVWHCHILSHEDHEMMRPLHVGPIPPPKKGGGKKGAFVGDQVEPDQFGEFRLYPNPASEQITVDLVLAEGAELEVSIYGLDGRMLNSEKLGYLNDGFQSILVPVDHLDNGMYILEVKAGAKQFRENIIVNK